MYFASNVGTAGFAFQKSELQSKSRLVFQILLINIYYFTKINIKQSLTKLLYIGLDARWSVVSTRDGTEGGAIWPSVQCGLPLIEFTMTFSLCASKRPFKLAGFLFTTPLFLFHPLLPVSMLPLLQAGLFSCFRSPQKQIALQGNRILQHNDTHVTGFSRTAWQFGCPSGSSYCCVRGQLTFACDSANLCEWGSNFQGHVL